MLSSWWEAMVVQAVENWVPSTWSLEFLVPGLLYQEETAGFPWWPSDKDSELPMQGA